MSNKAKGRKTVNTGNGFEAEVLERLQEITERQDELEDRLGDLGRGDNRHKVIIAEEFYKAKRDGYGIVEVSRISNMTPRPLSLALAVGDYLSPEIQSGEITLPRRRIDYFLRAQLSAFAGWNRDMSMDVLKEQVAGEAAAEAALAEELEAGGK